MDLLTSFVKSFASLFAIVDPIGVIPIFIAISAGMSAKGESNLVRAASWTVFIALTTAALFGEVLLSFLGVRISAFQVGGGILLLLMGIPMMKASSPETRSTPNEEAEMEASHESGAVPIGIPLLAGPAALSHVIIASHDIGKTFDVDMLPLLGAIAGVSLSTWIVLRASRQISGKMGAVGIGISMRVMGLVLSAVAIETIAKGLSGLFPKLFV